MRTCPNEGRLFKFIYLGFFQEDFHFNSIQIGISKAEAILKNYSPPLREAHLLETIGNRFNLTPHEIDGYRQVLETDPPKQKPKELQNKHLGNSTSPLTLYNGGKVEKVEPIQLSDLTEPGPRVDLVEGLIPKGHPTTLYGEGGNCKSLLALMIGFYVVSGKDFVNLKTHKTNVLYVDWELDEDEHSRRAYKIARGFNLDKPPQGLYYLRADRPLKDMLQPLKNFIEKSLIGLLILDSFGAACGEDSELARVVIPLLSGLRSLGTTQLILDHQAKLQHNQKYSEKTPFGSVYKFNLSRSVIQTQKQESTSGVQLVLKQTKSNLGSIAQPVPLKLTFEEKKIQIELADLSNHALYFESLSTEQKVAQELRANGPGTNRELAVRAGIKENTLTNVMGRMKRNGIVVEVGKRSHAPIYGLKSLNPNPQLSFPNSTSPQPYSGNGEVEKTRSDVEDAVEEGFDTSCYEQDV